MLTPEQIASELITLKVDATMMQQRVMALIDKLAVTPAPPKGRKAERELLEANLLKRYKRQAEKREFQQLQKTQS